MRNISVIWNKEIPPAHTFKVNTKEKKMLPKIKKKKLYWCHFLSDSGRMFEMPLSLSPCRASKSNHSLWLQQYLERCKNWFSVHVCVCALVGAEGAACLCRCVYLFIYFIFFWGGECNSFTCRLWFLCACLCLCLHLCVYGHVFLMKAHAGQINSQKLRGGGSPSLWNGAYCSL